MRAGKLQRAPEMPFPGRQVVHLRQHQAKEIVAVRAARIHAQRRTCHLAGVRQPAVRHENLHQLVVGPLGARIRADHGVQGLDRLERLTPLLLYQVTQLERIDVAGGALESLRGSRLGARQIAAPQGLAATDDDGMGRRGTGHTAAMVPASRRLV